MIVISKETWVAVGRLELSPAVTTLRGPDSHAILTIGRFVGTFTHGSRQAKGDVYVVKKLIKPLLGRPTIQDLDLVKIVAAVHQPIKDRYPSLFKGLGKMKSDYQIELYDDAQPYTFATPRRVAIPLLQSMQQELDRMENNEVISKVNEPTEWCSGMVVVPKADSKIQICVDLSKLNESVIRERHPR